ncbi:hypothetical protein Tco_1560469, partial [Tanacetum coccineum]
MIPFLVAPRVSALARCDKGRVDGLVEEVEELENQRAELVDELVIKIVKKVTEVTEQIEALMKSSTSPCDIQGDVRNVSVNNGRGDCSYKEFLACNPKDYDGKSGAIVYTRWIKKMESVQDMSGCGDNQKVMYTAGSFIETEPTTIQSAILKAGVLTDEAIRNGSLKKNTKKRGNGGEPSRDGNVKDDKKRSRTGRAFAT